MTVVAFLKKQKKNFCPLFKPIFCEGLIYLPAVVMVGYYFEKKRAMATGV
jgi:hypothetical protein